ncbi:MAG: hexulose-6-phosphate isomerase [Pelosinus sp.]|jgi:hexulose-6-phosphate isomerase|nr:hexulose-6-phosphate isomerase [Pelosinus sp.]
MENLLGLYEKALPQNMDWSTKLKTAKKLGFNFMEISIDETDERLARLCWTKEEKRQLLQSMDEIEFPIMSMCFSGHRRYPLGSRNPKVRGYALDLMAKAIEFASDMGIRVIQLAGYDVYYEEHGEDTLAYFIEGLKRAVIMAAKYQVTLAIEIMDTPFLNSIQKYMQYDHLIQSPWLALYPDIGNLSAWGNDVGYELELGYSRIVAVHVKETINVTERFPGMFRDTPFGKGDVDFVTAFKKLKSLGYSGPFLIEMWGDTFDDPVAEIARSREFILSKLKEGGFTKN